MIIWILINKSFKLVFSKQYNCRKSQGMHKQGYESGRNQKNSFHMILSLTDRQTDLVVLICEIEKI